MKYVSLGFPEITVRKKVPTENILVGLTILTVIPKGARRTICY
jgi:hypothetical protein